MLTNHHVIDNATDITVRLPDGRLFNARRTGSDAGADIGLLKIDANRLTTLAFGDSEALEIGDFVIAIGNPFGLGQTVTSGIVSALGRSGISREKFEDFIQTDAPINPGNSGGALINTRGELVGINTAIIAPSGGNIGIGFVVAAKWRARSWDSSAGMAKCDEGVSVCPYRTSPPRLLKPLFYLLREAR